MITRACTCPLMSLASIPPSTHIYKSRVSTVPPISAAGKAVHCTSGRITAGIRHQGEKKKERKRKKESSIDSFADFVCLTVYCFLWFAASSPPSPTHTDTRLTLSSHVLRLFFHPRIEDPSKEREEAVLLLTLAHHILCLVHRLLACCGDQAVDTLRQ